MTRLRATSQPALLAALLLLAAAGVRAQGTPAAPDSLRAGPVTLYFHPSRAELARALGADAAALADVPAIPDTVISAARPARVYLAADEAAFLQLTGGRAPEWGAGVAMSNPERIVLPAFDSDRGAARDLARTLRHELAHIALDRYLDPAFAPRWFHEGFARWAAGEWNWEEAWMLRVAFMLHRAPPLDSLELAWPRRAANARVAYALSASAIAFLVERGGERALALMLARWRETGSLEQALRRTYGLTLGQLEEDWRTEVRREYGWLFFLSHSAIFWVAVTLMTVLLFLPRRRHSRRKLERLREMEEPDRPAYWLEEPADDAAPDERR